MKTNPEQLLAKFDREALDDQVLGRRLTAIREQAQLTRPVLEDYETGSIPLGITRMRQIASALDTDAATLLCRLIFPLS